MKNIKKESFIIENPLTRNFLADAHFPEDNNRLPLIIFAHGYKGYKDWGAWDLMAEKFAEAGYYFVKFNFSHNGTTLEHPRDFADLEAFGQNNFSKEMLDYEAVINFFVKQPQVDVNRIAIIGHSRGGGITVIKAFEDDRVKALVTLAGVSNFSYRFPSDERMEDWKNKSVMYSENKRTHQNMPHFYQFYEDYKANEDRFNIQYAAQHLQKPFLILHGTEDEAVKEKEANLLYQWCKTSELHLLENAGHTFGAKEPWPEEQLPSDLQKATEISINFFKNNL